MAYRKKPTEPKPYVTRRKGRCLGEDGKYISCEWVHGLEGMLFYMKETQTYYMSACYWFHPITREKIVRCRPKRIPVKVRKGKSYVHFKHPFSCEDFYMYSDDPTPIIGLNKFKAKTLHKADESDIEVMYDWHDWLTEGKPTVEFMRERNMSYEQFRALLKKYADREHFYRHKFYKAFLASSKASFKLTDRQKRYLTAYNQIGTISDAARFLGVHRQDVHQVLKAISLKKVIQNVK